MAARAETRPPRALTTPVGLRASPGLAVRRGPAPLALAVYGLLALVTVAVAVVRGTSPLDTESWLDLPDWSRHLVSVAGGAMLAFGTVAATRLFVRRSGWARM